MWQEQDGAQISVLLDVGGVKGKEHQVRQCRDLALPPLMAGAWAYEPLV